MPATTPDSLLPYPAATDPADVPADLQRLALALDEIAYVQFTVTVNVPVVAEASAVVVVTTVAITYEAAPIVIEFFSPAARLNAAGGTLDVNLWDAGTNLGTVAESTVATTQTMYAARRLTPTAGSHTYGIRAWATGQAGTIYAGTGGIGQYCPGFIRIRRA
jgi:hypothetical protein